MNPFSDYHPGVILLYFVAVIAVNIVVFDPVVFGISFVSLGIFYLYITGGFAGVSFVGRCLLFVVVCMVVNALVNHRGVTVLFRMGGLPVTFECVFYGMMTGLLLAGSILTFGCCHRILTSEKIMCLMGNFFPSFSLLFSMALGLVPKLKRDYEKIRENHRLVENKKVQMGILSTLIGLSLEDCLETGISMKYRGFGGGKKRMSICRQTFERRDGIVAVVILLLAASGLSFFYQSGTGISVFPYIEYECDGGGIAAYVCVTILFNLPMILNAKEELKWNRIVSKI